VSALEIDETYLRETLKTLLSIPSPSGYTDKIARWCCEELERLGIEYELLDPDDARPGLHVVSATLLAGVPYPVPSGAYCRRSVRPNQFVRYQSLTPVAVPGGSVFVYRVDEETAAKLRNAPPYDPG